ncbi:MAG: hypothetical protein H5U40_14040 [Polyangiaceae bacterium]|nr:hypothetical protein [Polyangiaceae bacterium]
MPVAFYALMFIYGLLCFIFAFVEPPDAVRGLFKVPAIFVFLPDRWVMPAGRIFVGLCSWFVTFFLYFKLS